MSEHEIMTVRPPFLARIVTLLTLFAPHNVNIRTLTLSTSIELSWHDFSYKININTSLLTRAVLTIRRC